MTIQKWFTIPIHLYISIKITGGREKKATCLTIWWVSTIVQSMRTSLYFFAKFVRMTTRRKNIGLYKDDGLSVFKNCSGSYIEKVKKNLLKLFQNNGPDITVEKIAKISLFNSKTAFTDPTENHIIYSNI